MSVNHNLNYLEEQDKEKVLRDINKKIEVINDSINVNKARMDVNKETLDLLNKNKELRNESGTDINQLKLAFKYYEQQITELKIRDLATLKKNQGLEIEKTKLSYQLKELNDKKDQPTGEIMIKVQSEQAADADFSISYIVANAGWFPKYDIRAKDVSSPVELKYKAQVHQNTGEDWNNVQLTFSNADPNQIGIAPSLNTWYLDYAQFTVVTDRSYGAISGTIKEVRGKVIDPESNSGLPGVNVYIQGTSIGTITDLDGNYSLVVPNNSKSIVFSSIGFAAQTLPIDKPILNVVLETEVTSLNEVVVTGYAARSKSNDKQLAGRVEDAKTVETIFIEKQTSISLKVEIPYTIKSNGESMLIDLQKISINASFEYYSIPKIDPDAFLIARVINWDQYNLLEGEANLYFENTYVGRTVLNTNIASDTLDISLGRDKSIVINRKKLDQFTRRNTMGINKVDSRGFSILIRNNKSKTVNISILDQVPISARSEIVVNPLELSGANLDKQNGELKWTFKLDPQEQKELKFQYEVRYPKSQRIILE